MCGVNYLNALGLNSLICKMGMVIKLHHRILVMIRSIKICKTQQPVDFPKSFYAVIIKSLCFSYEPKNNYSLKCLSCKKLMVKYY